MPVRLPLANVYPAPGTSSSMKVGTRRSTVNLTVPTPVDNCVDMVGTDRRAAVDVGPSDL